MNKRLTSIDLLTAEGVLREVARARAGGVVFDAVNVATALHKAAKKGKREGRRTLIWLRTHPEIDWYGSPYEHIFGGLTRLRWYIMRDAESM